MIFSIHTSENKIPLTDARSIAKKLLSEQYTKITHEKKLPQIEKLRHGKPVFLNKPELHFSISHCDYAVAVCMNRTQCGIDVECKRQIRHKIVAKLFTENEQTILENSTDKDTIFTQFWTIKEAVSKAHGGGATVGFRNIDSTMIQKNNALETPFGQFQIHLYNSENIFMTIAIARIKQISPSDQT